MPTVIIPLKEFSRTIKDMPKAISEKQKKAFVRGVVRSIPQLIKSSPIDTGQYAASWDHIITRDAIFLGNFAPHAPIIEVGARPFVPPIGPLLAWAKRVLRDPSQPPEFSNEVWRLAKGTQKKIAAQGMKPRHILRNQIPNIINNIRNEMNKGGPI